MENEGSEARNAYNHRGGERSQGYRPGKSLLYKKRERKPNVICAANKVQALAKRESRTSRRTRTRRTRVTRGRGRRGGGEGTTTSGLKGELTGTVSHGGVYCTTCR